MRYLTVIADHFVGPASGARQAADAQELAPLRSLQAPGAWHTWWNRPVDEPSIPGTHRAGQVGVRRLVPRH